MNFFNRLIRVLNFTRLQAMHACQAINNINKLANLHPASAGCFGSQNQNKLAAMLQRLQTEQNYRRNSSLNEIEHGLN
ncbi:hypothetical protein L21SP5_03139 [Salinivirga cyanobacteriivorans]|uniref:Uncharacterized protein n=1 Tax=Salinivirga cyanobacteriivorans TaxID=1307839 RepID=A0A0S2I3C6_9BACT|nr:hypothetical protein L21SP5_03139 [Salinivirga cyanobacteriivorans]